MIEQIKNAIRAYVDDVERGGFSDDAAHELIAMQSFVNLTQSQIDTFCTICDASGDGIIDVHDDVIFAIEQIIS